MMHLQLSADEVLTTTRAVRRRLDLSRPVEQEVLQECLELAVQAPTGRNRQYWDFIVVTDAQQRRALAKVYRRGPQAPEPLHMAHQPGGNFSRAKYGEDITDKTYAGLHDLIEHLEDVPALVIPCIHGRTEGASIFEQANTRGSILPVFVRVRVWHWSRWCIGIAGERSQGGLACGHHWRRAMMHSFQLIES